LWLDELLANINRSEVSVCNSAKWNPSTWPAAASGWGSTEAPRGALGHWVSFSEGKITNYQAVVPTTWSGSPRDAAGTRGPFEQALLGTPVADVNRPLEILRTIHSFDPCMACAVHAVDARKRPVLDISNAVMRPEAV
jgi:hydrogenase large subunit